MPIKWGTDSKVEYLEPTYKFPLSIGASGEMSLRIEDSRKFLIKVAGMDPEIDRQEMMQFFRALLMTKIKSYIAQTMSEQRLTIFNIDENLTLLSENLRILLKDDFSEYGVTLERFYVTTVVKPDGEENYEKFKSLHLQGDLKLNGNKEAENTIYCENCGEMNQDTSSFCEYCGHALYDKKDICLNCGYVFTRKGNYCPKCGKKRG